MKIYTYYQEINFSSQNELIDLWKVSWSRQGYEPIVLNLDDSKKHPYFETLNSEMRRICKAITNKEISSYGMSCWLRWLAYATQTEEKFYVSDYDAINVNFPITEPNDKLHLMDHACPFLASGTPKLFEALCKAFVEVSNERIEVLKRHTKHYHDQEFFQYNFTRKFNESAEGLMHKYNILMTRDRTKFGGPDINVNSLVYHVSHYMTNITINRNPFYQSFKQKCKERSRVMVVRELLKIK